MAYLTTLAAVPMSEVNRLVADDTVVLTPTRYEFVSHYLALPGVEIQSLRGLLGEAIDGGKVINDKLWHPLRSPRFHSPDAVRELYDRFYSEWEAELAKVEISPKDWYRVEIEKVLAVFQYAALNDECVVNVIHPPMDAERADRVHIPLAAKKRISWFTWK